MRDLGKLTDGLVRAAQALKRTPVENAQEWADTYASYAADAQSVIDNTPVGIAAAKAILTVALVPAFALAPPPANAALMAQAFTSFWMAPPLVFAGSFPGLITAAPGAAALPSAILAAWSANLASRSNRQQAMERIAQALHAFTSTIICTDATIPNPTLGPIL